MGTIVVQVDLRCKRACEPHESLDYGPAVDVTVVCQFFFFEKSCVSWWWRGLSVKCDLQLD